MSDNAEAEAAAAAAPPHPLRNDEMRQIINMALRLLMTLILGIGAWQFQDIKSDVKTLSMQVQDARTQLAKNETMQFSMKDWIAQKDILDRRDNEQDKVLIQAGMKIATMSEQLNRIEAILTANQANRAARDMNPDKTR